LWGGDDRSSRLAWNRVLYSPGLQTPGRTS
jgi:hypothetical protein